MDFKMDEQSYRDLSIFPSLFDLFKKTKTLGGRERMEELMRNPSNSIEELQQRTAAIQFFIKSKIELNINHDQFDLILHYLNYDQGYLRGNVVDAFFPWLRNWIRPNQGYYVVQVGMKYLLSLLKYANEFSTTLIETNASVLLVELAHKIKAVLEKLNIDDVHLQSPKKGINFYKLGKLDSLIRRQHRLIVLDFLHLFYELDVLEKLSKVAEEQNFCLAEYIKSESISVEVVGLYHPALA